MAFQLRLSSEVVGDTEQATASWSKRRYEQNERTRLGKAESTKPDLADNLHHIYQSIYCCSICPF
jgi:hypothetical protein